MNDVLLITVDCWRNDAINSMPALKAETEDWKFRDLLTAGAATNGVFPAIYASSYPDQVYEAGGSVTDNITTLPSRLSTAGFSTAGFSASNPFLGKWNEVFDTFWNDGMASDLETKNRTESPVSKGWRFLTLEPRVPDADVLEMARNWWLSTPEPRFMHVHLMGPHAPYYPGLATAWRIGPIRSYLSIVGYAKRRENLPPILRKHVKRLYDQCIAHLDEVLSKFLTSLSDDFSIVLTADHGEEFDHGRFGHARLYNETTRCPYLTNDPKLVPSASAIRQVDLAPTILNRVNVSIPDSWEGVSATYNHTPLQPMQNKGTRHGREWFGVHDETRKLIQTFDNGGELLSEELYKLDEDPHEKAPLEDVPNVDETRQAVSAFKSRFSRDEHGRNSLGLNSDVNQRLRELGYR